MIETRPTEAWAAYTLNDAVDLFMKHSTTPISTSRRGGGRYWSFVFGPGQLRQMKNSRPNRHLYVVLIGGSAQLKDTQKWSVCLLEPDEVEELLDFSLTFQQAITVMLSSGKQLRVYRERKEIKVPQNRLDKWRVPGG